MKTLKHIFIALFILLISVFIPFYLKPNNPYLFITLFLIIGFFIFNFVIRKSLSYKGYFTSNYNLLTSKFMVVKSFEISKNLMFEKTIEVIDHSKFKLVETNKEKLEILAISPITFKSWGENIYIDIESSGNKTIMNFCSTTLFQISSWGKNEKNYIDFLNEFENSLII